MEVDIVLSSNVESRDNFNSKPTTTLKIGMGAEIHALSLSLTLAYMSNRTLVSFSNGWVYAGEECEANDESCYLRPLSACQPPKDQEEIEKLVDWGGKVFFFCE
jgi:hypothetical protein